MINPIAVAIPFFLVTILGEMGWSARKGLWARPRPIYRLPDALGDLGCGLTSQVTGLVLNNLVLAAAYEAASRLAPVSLGTGPGTWIFAFVALDFCYYWWHRASHRVNFMWAAHVVHHQSEDYNLAVALRQAIFTPLTSIPFYVPMALIGVPTTVFAITLALNTLYQFWIHTRLVGRMGWVEAVFNTPSHHRVHHGINPQYIDRNHAGVFIVWDRLFGTFEPEKGEPVYGVVEGFDSFDVWAANLRPYAKLARLCAACRGIDRVRAWLAPPEWRPAYLGGPVVIPEPNPALRFDPRVSPGVQRYAFAAFFVQAAVLFVLLLGVPTAFAWLGAAFILAGQLTQSGLLHGRGWARGAEVARWVVSLGGLACLSLS